MNDRFHRLLKTLISLFFVLSSSTSFSSDSIWDSSPLGKCYSSVGEYMLQTFGEEYKSDENLKISDADRSSKYKWVYDATPEKNITRVLFNIGKDSACIILYAPFVSAMKSDKGNFVFSKLPTYFISSDAPAPGFPQTEIHYLQNKRGLFAPADCYHISDHRKQKLDCNKVFTD